MKERCHNVRELRDYNATSTYVPRFPALHNTCFCSNSRIVTHDARAAPDQRRGRTKSITTIDIETLSVSLPGAGIVSHSQYHRTHCSAGRAIVLRRPSACAPFPPLNSPPSMSTVARRRRCCPSAVRSRLAGCYRQRLAWQRQGRAQWAAGRCMQLPKVCRDMLRLGDGSQPVHL